jgi:hypothetical protein
MFQDLTALLGFDYVAPVAQRRLGDADLVARLAQAAEVGDMDEGAKLDSPWSYTVSP